MSLHLNGTDDLTAAGGLAAHELKEVPNSTGARKLTTTLIWTGGIFYDRNGSLLSSLVLGGTRGYAVRLNIYPGIVKVRGFSPGLALLLRHNGDFIAGIFIHWLPLGVAGRIA